MNKYFRSEKELYILRPIQFCKNQYYSKLLKIKKNTQNTPPKHQFITFIT